MKKIILLFLLSSCFAFSQNSKTSIDEYNYMKTGYYIAQKNGLDLKKGYLVVDLVTHDYSDYKFEYKKLIRQSDNKCVGILLNAKSKLWSNDYHLALPFDNNDLLLDYVADVQKWDKAMLNAYSQSSSVLFSAFSNVVFNN